MGVAAPEPLSWLEVAGIAALWVVGVALVFTVRWSGRGSALKGETPARVRGRGGPMRVLLGVVIGAVLVGVFLVGPYCDIARINRENERTRELLDFQAKLIEQTRQSRLRTEIIMRGLGEPEARDE